MILRIVNGAQVERFIPDLTKLFAAFLKDAHEPFTVEQQWAAILKGLGMKADFLFLVAFNERVRPVAYLTAFSAEDLFGVRFASVMQVYTVPGTPSVMDGFEQRLEQWAADQKAHVLSGLTHHGTKGFARWMKRRGWVPYAAMYVKFVGSVRNGQTTAGPAPSGHQHDPAGTVGTAVETR